MIGSDFMMNLCYDQLLLLLYSCRRDSRELIFQCQLFLSQRVNCLSLFRGSHAIIDHALSLR